MNNNKKRLRALLNIMQNAANKIAKNKSDFDSLIEEIYGYHYSDRDLDEIIDSVDYGLGKLTFKEFNKIMIENKNKK